MNKRLKCSLNSTEKKFFFSYFDWCWDWIGSYVDSQFWSNNSKQVDETSKQLPNSFSNSSISKQSFKLSWPDRNGKVHKRILQDSLDCNQNDFKRHFLLNCHKHSKFQFNFNSRFENVLSLTRVCAKCVDNRNIKSNKFPPLIEIIT